MWKIKTIKAKTIKKRKRLLGAFLAISFVPVFLMGCQRNDKSSSTDIFDAEGIDVAFLKGNGALFFEEYAFAQGAKNHIFKIEGDGITKHTSYPFIKFDPTNYEKLVGKSIDDVVRTVGIPSYLGEVGKKSLDYSNTDGRVRRLHFLNDNSEFLVENVETFIKSYDKHYNVFFDRNADPVSKEKIKRLRVGMCADEIIETLGSKINGGIKGEDFNDWKLITSEGDVAHLIVCYSDSFGCSHLTVNESDRWTMESWYLFGAYSEDGEIIIENKLGNSPAVFDANDNRFSETNDITIEYLKENNCFFFGDYVFASDSKNHVFKTKDGSIASHATYDKISYPRNPINLFESVKGLELEETFNIIGIPSFVTKQGSMSVDYVLPNGYLLSYSLETKDEKIYLKSYSGNSFTWTCTDCWKDTTNVFVSKAKINLIKPGMCIAEATQILGKASSIRYLDENKTAYVFSYPLDDGSIFELNFKIKVIEKQCEHAVRYSDVGTSLDKINSNSNNVALSNCLYLYVSD